MKLDSSVMEEVEGKKRHVGFCLLLWPWYPCSIHCNLTLKSCISPYHCVISIEPHLMFMFSLSFLCICRRFYECGLIGKQDWMVCIFILYHTLIHNLNFECIFLFNVTKPHHNEKCLSCPNSLYAVITHSINHRCYW